MERRSDKYNNLEKPPEKHSRVQKNRYLYDEMNSKIGYEEITNLDAPPQFDLSSININNPSREEYQKIREYKHLLKEDDKKTTVKELEDENRPKTFDINVVLEEAKKNRKTDDLEKKRNLKDEEYSVLSNLNKKYLHNKEFTKEDDEELKELIDTITSKTLVNDIKDEEEKELLSDLLATTIDIKLENELSEEEINKLYEEKKNNSPNDPEQEENSFYTKSLELSKDDLIGEEESENEEKEKGKNRSTIKIILISLILISVLCIVTYFLLKTIGITFD